MGISFTTTERPPCPVDGKPLPPNRDKYCSDKCAKKGTENAARTRKREAHIMEFIGVDGEGVNIEYPDGHREHHYIMLSVGEATLWKHGQPLTHKDIFPFLWEQYQAHPHAVFIGFALGYDFTMWLKSLTERKARALLDKNDEGYKKRYQTHMRAAGNRKPYAVIIDDTWMIDMLPSGNRFRLRPWVAKEDRTDSDDMNEWMYICDTFNFWQSSFLAAINPASWTNGDTPCTAEEFEIIKQGKSDRGTRIAPGDISYFDDMVRYNKLENEILGRAMTILNQGFTAIGVKLNKAQYFGPGQAAQAWLNKTFKGHPAMKREDLDELIDKEIRDAFQHSYYGGWFETFYIGHLPGVTYEYDKRSAYPDAMTTLPCLCSAGGWRSGSGTDYPRDYDIVLLYGHFTSQPRKQVGALPYRLNKDAKAKRGSVVHPDETQGWYLLSEVEAAKKAHLLAYSPPLRWIAYKATCGHEPPLARLRGLYEERKRVGKNTPPGRAIKLVLNSMYGKFAQSAGEAPYGNPIYATMITSHCRTAMLEAIGTHPVGADHVAMIATDGIYFRSKHRQLDAIAENDVLGGWERAEKQNLTLMKPGVYWDDKSRVKDKDKFKIRSRGIPAAVLWENIERLDREFQDYYESGCTTSLPQIEMTIPFSFITPKSALARNNWALCGQVIWEEDPEAKRVDKATVVPKRTDPYTRGDYVRTKRPPAWTGLETEPYDKTFGYRETILERTELDDVTPDGDIWGIIAFSLDLRG